MWCRLLRRLRLPMLALRALPTWMVLRPHVAAGIARPRSSLHQSLAPATEPAQAPARIRTPCTLGLSGSLRNVQNCAAGATAYPAHRAGISSATTLSDSRGREPRKNEVALLRHRAECRVRRQPRAARRASDCTTTALAASHGVHARERQIRAAWRSGRAAGEAIRQH